ncbi:MAG: response regulator [Caldithrix sp.]|nr:response regulator [Caldithrix sp.]
MYWPSTIDEPDVTKIDETSEFANDISETILVVEDDTEVRELASSFLNTLGYRVLEAANGKKALELVKKNNKAIEIDLVLTDVVMPHMNGEELAESIRKLNPHIKIILTSGYTDSKLIKSGLKEKGFSFLPKPYSIQKMAKRIRKALDDENA